jgi:hypothetical protein
MKGNAFPVPSHVAGKIVLRNSIFIDSWRAAVYVLQPGSIRASEPKWLTNSPEFDKFRKMMLYWYVGNEPNRLIVDNDPGGT